MFGLETKKKSKLDLEFEIFMRNLFAFLKSKSQTFNSQEGSVSRKELNYILTKFENNKILFSSPILRINLRNRISHILNEDLKSFSELDSSHSAYEKLFNISNQIKQYYEQEKSKFDRFFSPHIAMIERRNQESISFLSQISSYREISNIYNQFKPKVSNQLNDLKNAYDHFKRFYGEDSELRKEFEDSISTLDYVLRELTKFSPSKTNDKNLHYLYHEIEKIIFVCIPNLIFKLKEHDLYRDGSSKLSLVK